MAILNQKRILNLIPKVSAPVTIHVSQGDVGTQIEFTLVKGDEVFVNPGNVTASVHGVREDGANFGPFTCTLSGSKVIFPLHSEMTAVKGSAIAEIVLVDNGGNKVGSANFGILVEGSVFPLGVTYDNDVSVYESILAYVQSSAAQLTDDYTSKINAVQSGLNNEISTRTSEDALINTRIDEIIAPSGEAPNPSEIVDARIGWNNKNYANLGESIRKQVSGIYDAFIALMNETDILNILNINFFPRSGYTDGYYINPSNGNPAVNASFFYTDYIYIKKSHTYRIIGTTTNVIITYYDINKTFISGESVTSGTKTFTSPANAEYCRLSCGIAGRANYNLLDGGSLLATTQGSSYYIELLKNYALKVHDYEVLVPTVASILPDLNDAEVNKVYNVTLSAYMIDGIPAHMPYNIYLEPFTLMTFSNKSGYKMQYIFGCTGVFMRIYASGTWLDWWTIKKPVAHVPNAKALIQLVESGLPCEINLETDIELYSDYKTAKGEDYWDSYVGYSVSGNRNDSGLYLHPHVDFNGNGHTVAFSIAPSDLTVAIQRDFSPFNLGGDNILENVFIDIGQGSGSGACRYAIHDDFAISTERIIMRNIQMRGTGHSGALIGAGVKPYCTHTVENCVCLDNAGDYDIAYHSNSAGTQAPSYLVIKNCYCEKSIIIRYLGNNQVITPCIITGNHAYSIIKTAGSGAIYDNMNLLAWNNETDI